MVWDLTRQNGGVAIGVMKMDQLRVSRCCLERFIHYHYLLEHKFHGCYLTHNHSHSKAHSCTTRNIHIDSYNVE